MHLNYKTTRFFITLIVVAMLVLFWLKPATAPAMGPPQKKSNILFILADQYRYDCIGANGNSKIHTPNLDRLAAEGMRFDRMYAAQPVCSPNRAAIITGLYPHTNGVWENNVSLPKTSRTMSEMLAPTGYDCGHFGKWHLVRRDAFKTFPQYPKDGRGKNHYFGKGKSRRYGVDVITEDAVKFMQRKRKKPFYLYVSFYPPHPPYSVPGQYLERYKHIADKNKRTYYAMCTKVDEKVGELLAALDKMKIADKTLVAFNTDHGHYFEHRWNDHYKRLCYDVASRLPLIMRMPQVIPVGQKTDGLIGSVDLTPTILALVGQPIPPGLQGKDLSQLARGKTSKGRDYVFIENIPYPHKREKGQERCIRDQQWKMILSTHRKPELYDMIEDPTERNNRWAEMKNSPVADRLCKQLHQWSEKTKDTLTPKLLKNIKAERSTGN
ncbi:MAG: sulfatase family protein [Planctomycetota bacterium]|jgi:arylsulfatase A-like enzyme